MISDKTLRVRGGFSPAATESVWAGLGWVEIIYILLFAGSETELNDTVCQFEFSGPFFTLLTLIFAQIQASICFLIKYISH